MAVHSSILAWRIPWTEEPGRLQPKGSQRVRHDWATWYARIHILQIQSTACIGIGIFADEVLRPAGAWSLVTGESKSLCSRPADKQVCRVTKPSYLAAVKNKTEVSLATSKHTDFPPCFRRSVFIPQSWLLNK